MKPGQLLKPGLYWRKKDPAALVPNLTPAKLRKDVLDVSGGAGVKAAATRGRAVPIRVVASIEVVQV